MMHRGGHEDQAGRDAEPVVAQLARGDQTGDDQVGDDRVGRRDDDIGRHDELPAHRAPAVAVSSERRASPPWSAVLGYIGGTGFGVNAGPGLARYHPADRASKVGWKPTPQRAANTVLY